MERENKRSRNAENVKGRRRAKLRLDDEDSSLTEVGEEHDFMLWDELDSEERRHDPLRSPR